MWVTDGFSAAVGGDLMKTWYQLHGVDSMRRQTSAFNVERLNVQSKDDAKTFKRLNSVNNAEPVQTESSIDRVRQVNLIEKTQQVMTL